MPLGLVFGMLKAEGSWVGLEISKVIQKNKGRCSWKNLTIAGDTFLK